MKLPFRLPGTEVREAGGGIGEGVVGGGVGVEEFAVRPTCD